MNENEAFCRPLWELNCIWDNLTPAQKEEVSEAAEIVHYEKNDAIRCEGDASKHIWMLLSGKVRIYKDGVGQRQIIRVLKPFDLFGYRAAIADEPYGSSASAFEPSILYRIDSQLFRRLIQENGAFCYAMMQTMARDLKHSEIQTVNLTQKHIRGRLAESILHLISQYGYEEDGSTIAMLISREDLAHMSNMITSNAIRTLSQFAQEGLLAIDGKRIRILNAPALQKISRLG